MKYESMLSDRRIAKIRKAAENHFLYYEPVCHGRVGYAVNVGFQREVCSDIYGNVVFSNFDHDEDEEDQDIVLAKLTDSPDAIVKAYRETVKKYHLDEANKRREEDIDALNDSSIFAFDD